MIDLKILVLIASLAGSGALAYAAMPGHQADTIPESPLTFHLRISNESGLLVSTWPGERGSLEDPEDEDEGDPLTTNRSEVPAFLEPLARLIWAAPGAERLAVEGLKLHAGTTTAFRAPAALRLPATGILPEPYASDLDPRRIPESGRDGTIADVPIFLWNENETIHYRVNITDDVRLRVNRAEGLYLEGRIDGGLATFTLVAPEGQFSSLGCSPIPGTSVPPGHYVAADSGGSGYIVYENKIAYLLEEKTVNAMIHLIGEDDE